jgi:diguanylate cyclase (GGDEF)-like protein
LIDARVSLYRQAAEALRKGHFDVSIPVGESDEVSELGEALEALAQALKVKSAQSKMLAQIAEQVSEGLLINETLDHVYENFISLIPYDRIGLALLEQGGTVLRSHWVRSEASEVKLSPGFSAGLAGSSLEEIIRTGRPRILNDLEAYLEEHPRSGSTRRIVEEGMRSSLTCPLVVKGKPVGFLFFSSMKVGTYDEVHQDFFVQIAGQLAVTLEKGRIYQELLDTTKELREAKDRLQKQASRDSLTELWNRRAIIKLLEREIARAQRESKPLAAVMVDIDNFKLINDRFGHPAGDEVLTEVTRRIASALRTADIFGRIGGEEFLIILCPADAQTTIEVMERARRACEARPFVVENGDLEVTISLGAAVVNKVEDVDLSIVLKTADRALYRSKEGGRNRFEVEFVCS